MHMQRYSKNASLDCESEPKLLLLQQDSLAISLAYVWIFQYKESYIWQQKRLNLYIHRFSVLLKLQFKARHEMY